MKVDAGQLLGTRSDGVIQGMPHVHVKDSFASGAKASFLDALGTSIKQERRATLEQLLEAIDVCGQILLKEMNLSAAQKYRQTVQAFIAEATNDMYSVAYDFGSDSGYRNKNYTLVKCVNDKMERMIHRLRESDREPLFILETINDIKGMLIDIMT